MKTTKLLSCLLPLVLLLFTACEKDPDTDDLSVDLVVRTDYMQDAEFVKKPKYFIGDTIYVIGSSKDKKTEKWAYGTNEKAKEMLDLVKDRMDTYGYEVQADTTGVDLRMQITYIEDMYYYLQLYYDYWWDYWENWGGWYWGYYPYYPYPVFYTYKTGSLIIDMVDNKATPIEMSKGKKAKPVIWNTYASGLISGNKNFNQKLVLKAINEAFDQSPYLNIDLILTKIVNSKKTKEL